MYPSDSTSLLRTLFTSSPVSQPAFACVLVLVDAGRLHFPGNLTYNKVAVIPSGRRSGSRMVVRKRDF